MAQSFTPNDTKNVSVGGGVLGGYFFSAPLGTPLPKTVWDPLDPAFVNEGYLSQDGINKANETDSEVIPDLNGTPIVSTHGAKSITLTLQFAELKDATLKEMYGYGNVADANGQIRVEENTKEQEHRVYIARLALRDGRLAYMILPDGQCAVTGELPVNSTTLFAAESTITAYGDANGNLVLWLIESTETDRPTHAEAPEWSSYLGKSPADFGAFTYGSDTIKGVANKVTGFKAFSGSEDMQEGYYLPFSVPNPRGAKITGKKTTTVEDDDPAMILFLGKEKPELERITVEGVDGKIEVYDLGITAAEA